MSLIYLHSIGEFLLVSFLLCRFFSNWMYLEYFKILRQWMKFYYGSLSVQLHQSVSCQQHTPSRCVSSVFWYTASVVASSHCHLCFVWLKDTEYLLCWVNLFRLLSSRLKWTLALSEQKKWILTLVYVYCCLVIVLLPPSRIQQNLNTTWCALGNQMGRWEI